MALRLSRKRLIKKMNDVIGFVIRDFKNIMFFQEQDLRVSVYYHLRRLLHQYIYLDTYLEPEKVDLRLAGDKKNQMLVEMKYDYQEGSSNWMFNDLAKDVQKLESYKTRYIPNGFLYPDSMAYFIYFTYRDSNHGDIQKFMKYCDGLGNWKTNYLNVIIYSEKEDRVIYEKNF